MVKGMKGLRGNSLVEYLNEWMWKNNIYRKNFENVLSLIKITIN